MPDTDEIWKVGDEVEVDLTCGFTGSGIVIGFLPEYERFSIAVEVEGMSFPVYVNAEELSEQVAPAPAVTIEREGATWEDEAREELRQLDNAGPEGRVPGFTRPEWEKEL